MANKPLFKPGNSTSCRFGDEILNGNVHWRNALLELLRYTNYTLSDITNSLTCTLSALLLIINHNDSSLLNFKQGARLLTMHDAAMNSKKHKPE